MKITMRFIACLVVCLVLYVPCAAQVGVWHQSMVHTWINLRGSTVVLAEKTIYVPEAGNVLVQFDGQCFSDPGDLIILAASKTLYWYPNDGHTEVEAFDSDIVIHPFSHSRMYSVSPGYHTFYALGENYVKTAGSGYAGIYGSLTIKYFPDREDEALVSHTGIIVTNQNMRGGPSVLAQRNITVGASGNALVRFDGFCLSDPGDRIMLAASNTTSWSGNDGTTAVEAADGYHIITPFCHSRMYSIGPGSHDFYAVAENLVEMDGDGIASVYGSLTVEFFPDSPGAAFVQHTGIVETNIYMEGAPVTMGQLTIDPATMGTAVVRYEGVCVSDPGDLIVLAASDDEDWDTNDGNVAVEAVDSDVNLNNFSHTRVYTIDAGSHTFYAVCENYVNTDGSGIASVYASLSVEFFPGVATGAGDEQTVPAAFELEQIYPNPFNPATTIAFTLPEQARVNLSIFDIEGRLVRTLIDELLPEGSKRVSWNGTDAQGRPAASGIYFCRLQAGERIESRKMVLIK